MLATLLRRLVSGQKRRFQDGGFDLDLAYISPRVIAMGLPAQGKDVLYRNPMQEITRFLQTYHRGHAKVYNLCSEHTYSSQQLSVALQQFPYDDHQVPPLALVQDFCVDAAAWLAADPANVVVVHCKAGKGRTGIMICCLMLYLHKNAPDLANLAPSAAAAAAISPPSVTRALAWAATAAEATAAQDSTAADVGPTCHAGTGAVRSDVSCGQQLCAAEPCLVGSGAWHPWHFVPPVQLRELDQPVQEILDLYAERRTHDGNGVTIKSQRRYTGYFWAVLCNGAGPVGLLLKPRAVQLRQVTISGLPPGTADSCVLLVEARPSGSLAPRASRVCRRAAPRAAGTGVAGLCMAPCTHPCVEDDSCSISSGSGGDTLTFNMPAASLGLSPMQQHQQQQESCTDPAMAPMGAAGAGEGGSCVTPFVDEGWDAADEDGCCVVEGDVRLVVLKGSTRLFYTWFNTAFLPFDGCYSLTKAQLDKPAKALPPGVTLTVRFVDMQPTAAVEDAAGAAAVKLPNEQQLPQSWAYGLADPPLETTIKPGKGTMQQHGKVSRHQGGKAISMLAEATVAARSRAHQGMQPQRPLVRCPSADTVAGAGLHEAPATCAVRVMDADSAAMQQLQPQAVVSQLQHKQIGAAQPGPAASSSNSAPASPQARRLRSSGSWRHHLPAISSISTSTLWGSSSDVSGHKSPSSSKLDSPSSWCGTAGFSWNWDTLLGAEDAAALRSVTDGSQTSRSCHSKVTMAPPAGAEHAAQQPRHNNMLQGWQRSRRSSSVDAADVTRGLGSKGTGVATLGLRELQSSIELPVMVKRPSGVDSLVDALLDPEHSTTPHPSANAVDTGMVLAAEASSSAVSGRGTAGYKPPSQLRKGYSWHGSNSWFAAMAGGGNGSVGSERSDSTHVGSHSARRQHRARASSCADGLHSSSAPYCTDALSLAAELDPLLLCEQSGEVPGAVLSGDPLQGLLEALNWSTDMRRYQGHDQPSSRSWRGAFSAHRLSTSSEPCSPRRCRSAVPTLHSVPLLHHARSAPVTPAAAAPEVDLAAADETDGQPSAVVQGKPAVSPPAAPPTPVRAGGSTADRCGRRPRVAKQDVCRPLDLEGWAEDESEGLDAADVAGTGLAPATAQGAVGGGVRTAHVYLASVGPLLDNHDCALSGHHCQLPEANGAAVKRGLAGSVVRNAAAAADVSCAALAARGHRPAAGGKARPSIRRAPATGAPSVMCSGGGSHWRVRGGHVSGSRSELHDDALQGLLSAEGGVQLSSADTPASMHQWQQLEKAWQKSWWV